MSNTHTTRFKKLKPWITNRIKISIKTREKLKKALKKNNSAQKLAEYKQYRNNLNKIIKPTKNEYYQKRYNENSSDIKIYNFISEATNNTKINQSISQIKGEDNELITNPENVADFCNDYFLTIGKKMSEFIPDLLSQL